MSHLAQWLASRHHGLNTYRGFQQQIKQQAALDTQHRALYHLLYAMADNYIEMFDEAPLPVDKAEIVFAKFLSIVRTAEESITLTPQAQLNALNEIAAVELA
jgi:hypothetical protein